MLVKPRLSDPASTATVIAPTDIAWINNVSATGVVRRPESWISTTSGSLANDIW